jgi:hypothetical protein
LRDAGRDLSFRNRSEAELAGYRDATDELLRKHAYYAALRASQAGWHEAAHDLWPWIGYLLRVLDDAYDDFARRVAAGTELVGATKEQRARNYILTQAPRSFRLAQVVDALPDVSQATIRKALDALKAEGRLQVGRGRSATWTRVDVAAREGGTAH